MSIPGNLLQGIWFLGDALLAFYYWAIIISAVLSWLVTFNVINTRNQFIYAVMDFLYRITEPALRPIRRFVPDLGGVDISPLILILLVFAIRRYVWMPVMFQVIQGAS